MLLLVCTNTGGIPLRLYIGFGALHPDEEMVGTVDAGEMREFVGPAGVYVNHSYWT